MAAYGRKWARGQVRRPSSFPGRAGECACVWRAALRSGHQKGEKCGRCAFLLAESFENLNQDASESQIIYMYPVSEDRFD